MTYFDPPLTLSERTLYALSNLLRRQSELILGHMYNQRAKRVQAIPDSIEKVDRNYG